MVYIDGEALQEDYINGTWTDERDGFTFHVPEGEYLMLGDNRNNSSDARWWARIAVLKGLASNVEEAEPFSYVSRKKILGKAYVRYWPITQIGSLY